MNQRVVVIVLVSLFTTCFVGTCAVTTTAVIGAALGDSKPEKRRTYEPPPEPEPTEPTESSTPPEPVDEVATAEPDVATDEELQPPDEPGDFEAPLIGTGEFAVFHQEKAKLDPWAALQKAAKGTKVKVFKGSAPASAIPPYLELRDLPVADYAVIAGETLEAARGLTPAAKAALPKAKRASVLDAALPLTGAPLFDVSKVLHSYAQLTGGVLWDEEAQEYLSAEAWKTRRIDSWEKGVPHVSMNFTVFVSTVGTNVEIHSAGLKHFGLPELELKAIPKASKDSAVALLNATAQVLAEAKRAPAPGPLTVELTAIRHAQHRKNLEAKASADAEKAVELVLVPGANEKVPTLAITFPGAGSPSERVEDGLSALFGAPE
ncbi:MAG: hypothetical protein Q8L48_43485 [Archangium sp.]|nr:hypothetical protein [Archangium sp.]